MKRTIFILIFSCTFGLCQEIPPVTELVNNISAQFERIEDYSVKVKISVDMPLFRMPRKRIELYYKKPDKLKIESDGFAVVPRSGLTISPDMFLSQLESVTVVRDETGGYFVTGNVLADSLDFPVSGASDSTEVSITVHVKSNPWVIDRVEAVSDTATVFAIKSEYEEVTPEIWMPVLTHIQIQFPDMDQNIMQQHGPAQMLELSKEPAKEGEIKIEYYKYKINKGIRDSFFNNADKYF